MFFVRLETQLRRCCNIFNGDWWKTTAYLPVLKKVVLKKYNKVKGMKFGSGCQRVGEIHCKTQRGDFTGNTWRKNSEKCHVADVVTINEMTNLNKVNNRTNLSDCPCKC